MDQTAPPPSVAQQLGAVARDIKLSHTVFALPFALLATFLAASWADRSPNAGEFALILLCMFFARTFAMTFNRLSDALIDARNKRTERRALPSGRVRWDTMLWVVLACALAFVVCTALFIVQSRNALPLILSLPVLAVLAGYSYTKRFTWLCHAFLGLALSISPIAAVIAIEPGYLGQPIIWLLALMVLTWVAGFDVLYALQDTEADRELGLYSIPSRLGISNALMISRGLHTVSIAALLGVAWLSSQLGVLFWIAAGVTCVLLLFEHALVWGGKTKQLNMAFFTVNGVISLLLGAAGIADIIARG
ncbi:MAG: putative 4-hydroxybenzoate polyprenyltransferase [Phycisphaeraceae bacterium]|nr:putative 4-hydroxybenzoate polyprenyltransferase [Phycisphaeraceae bacterium]